MKGKYVDVKYSRDTRINPIISGEFRNNLYNGDVSLEFRDIKETINIDDGILEPISLFIDNPIVCPKFSLYYRYSKNIVQSVLTIEEIIESYIYINPGIHKYSKSIELLHDYISRIFITPREINLKSLVNQLVIKYDISNQFNIHCTYDDKLILYKRGSLLSSKDRANHSRAVRQFKGDSLLRDIIHQAALLTIDSTDKYVSIKNKAVHNRMLLENDKSKICSYRKMGNTMADKTKSLITKANADTIFSSTTELEKYRKFLSFRESGVTVRDALPKLKISQSTYYQFAKISELYDI